MSAWSTSSLADKLGKLSVAADFKPAKLVGACSQRIALPSDTSLARSLPRLDRRVPTLAVRSPSNFPITAQAWRQMGRDS